MSGTESQTRQHEVEEEDEVQIVESSNMKDKFKWSQTKDEDLCKSWLTISNDGATGNHQSYNSYWQRIVDYYNEWRNDGDPIDIPKASNHWFKMSAEVSKFNGCYIQIKESHPSGHNEESLKNMANQLWSTDGEEISKKRPIGQKAAKAASKGRGSKKKGSEDFVNSFGEYKELQTKKFSLWEQRIRTSDFEILTKDTSNMDNRARKDHEQVCKIIRAKYGI
ncbi:glutathione S-transferase T3-like [Silene latifolia]|uniref:glutathione S-transferase T3-like n=1 Tax=Silene latifolia TaxID=37657 RepID=UPI003D787427